MIRFLTSGESHEKSLTVIIDGMPAGVEISKEFIHQEMKKRKVGPGNGGRQIIESDTVEIISGVRFGKTTGAPITLFIENKDFKNWGEKMSDEPQSQELINKITIKNPRPGHTDLAGVLKYDLNDVRDVLERASARETTARVAAGSFFKQFLENFQIEISSHTIQIGNITLKNEDYTFDDVKKTYTDDPEIRCIDKNLSENMRTAIMKARSEMNTLGGIVEVWAVNVPIGLGSHIQFDRKIDGQIAQALMSIQSVKAVEIGTGVENARKLGSEVHDAIFYDQDNSYYRKTNRAGGIEGGITNGMPIIARVYHKPISTLYKPMQTVNIDTKETDQATVERSDICVIPRAGVIAESMLAYVLTQNMLEKFGGDALEDIKKSYQDYKNRIQ